MKPIFPIILIDSPEWDYPVAEEYFRYDEYYYSGDQEFYLRFFHEKRFLDSAGQIFRAIEKADNSDILSTIGIRKKFRIRFEQEGVVWSLEDARSFLIDKIKNIPSDTGKSEWIGAVMRAQTIKELIEADRD